MPQQVGQVLTQTWNDLKRPTTRKKQPTTIWTYQQRGKKDAKPPTTNRFWDYFTVWGNRFSSLARFPSSIWLQSFEHRFMENYGENRALNIYCHVYLLRDIIFTGYVPNHCHTRKFIFASQRQTLWIKQKKIKFWHKKALKMIALSSSSHHIQKRLNADYTLPVQSNWKVSKFTEIKIYFLSSRNIAAQCSWSISYT